MGYMQRALELARRGEGFVEPNPMVGCVIVKAGRVVGEGWHKRFGGPHAEVFALRQAGAKARGATIYVSLEPCSHFGKTPPCVDALLAAKPKRVVAAMKDPFPLVAGRGLRKLRAAGIQVDVGLLRKEAAALIAPFITFHIKKRPYVILKWAQSIDGKIATRSGDSQWISGPASRRAAHAIRARVDAILVGANTALRDDPMLTARGVPLRRAALRIVLDSRLRISPNSQLVRTAGSVRPSGRTEQEPADAGAISARRDSRTLNPVHPVNPVYFAGDPTTLIVTAPDRSTAEKRRALVAAGCEVVQLPGDDRGIDLRALMSDLHGRGVTNLLVEGGGKVLGSFLDAGLADEAFVFIAPKFIGGLDAPGPLAGLGPGRLDDLPGCRHVALVNDHNDLCYHLRIEPAR